jgi:hypothetical protein
MRGSARLARYDKSSPPTTPAKAASKATTIPKDQQGQIVDKLAVENSRLDAKPKNYLSRVLNWLQGPRWLMATVWCDQLF